MKRREFTKSSLILGMSLMAGPANSGPSKSHNLSGDYYEEPGKKLPARKFDVVVAGGGTAGVVAAIAKDRGGAPELRLPSAPSKTKEYVTLNMTI